MTAVVRTARRCCGDRTALAGLLADDPRLARVPAFAVTTASAPCALLLPTARVGFAWDLTRATSSTRTPAAPTDG